MKTDDPKFTEQLGLEYRANKQEHPAFVELSQGPSHSTSFILLDPHNNHYEGNAMPALWIKKWSLNKCGPFAQAHVAGSEVSFSWNLWYSTTVFGNGFQAK